MNTKNNKDWPFDFEDNKEIGKVTIDREVFLKKYFKSYNYLRTIENQLDIWDIPKNDTVRPLGRIYELLIMMRDNRIKPNRFFNLYDDLKTWEKTKKI